MWFKRAEDVGGDPWVRAAAAVSMLLVVQPLVALWQFTWPPRLAEPGWFYGLFGTLAESVHLLVAGLLVAVMFVSPALETAARERLARVVWGGGIALGMSGIGLVAAAFAWVAELPREALASFWRETVVSAFALFLGAIVVLGLAYARSITAPD